MNKLITTTFIIGIVKRGAVELTRGEVFHYTYNFEFEEKLKQMIELRSTYNSLLGSEVNEFSVIYYENKPPREAMEMIFDRVLIYYKRTNKQQFIAQYIDIFKLKPDCNIIAELI